MTQAEFEQLVEEGFSAIPERLRKRVDNVAFFIEDEPSPAVRREQNLANDETLLGLYVGVPRTAREHYGVGMTLPDTITLYRRPIEDAGRGEPERIRAVVRDTIWHEVAHHFGLDEPAVRAHEVKRKRQH